MLEIVFSDSAAGALKMAQLYGDGSYNGGPIEVVVLSDGDDKEPSPEELQRAKHEASERARLEWENAVPMSGKASDVFGFSLALSVGSNLIEERFFESRAKVLRRLFSCYPDDIQSDAARALIDTSKKGLQTVLERAAAGESVRIWYSEQPDEYCGLCWLAEQLIKHKCTGNASLVKLPEWEIKDEKTTVRHLGWSDMEPDGFSRCLQYEQPATPGILGMLAGQWSNMRAEAMPLRAVISNVLTGVSEDFYDPFIRREITAQLEEFNEAVLIGRVLGKYRLGIGDSWIALRIEQMIADGELEVIKLLPGDGPTYRRILKKC